MGMVLGMCASNANVYVWPLPEDALPENEAAVRIFLLSLLLLLLLLVLLLLLLLVLLLFFFYGRGEEVLRCDGFVDAPDRAVGEKWCDVLFTGASSQ